MIIDPKINCKKMQTKICWLWKEIAIPIFSLFFFFLKFWRCKNGKIRNRAVSQNRDRFTGFTGSYRFAPVFPVFCPVLQTSGFLLLSGPVLGPVPGRTGRSGPVFKTLTNHIQTGLLKLFLSEIWTK
jgi:hypothetical protein